MSALKPQGEFVDRKYPRETGLVHARQYPQKSASVARRVVLNKCARLIPIPEPVPIMDRIASQHRNKGEKEQAYHQNHLEDRQIKLRDTKVPHTNHIQQRINDYHSHNDSLNGYLIRPEGDHDVHGDNFKGNEKRHVEEKVPCHGETQCVVDPFSTETDERGWDRHICHHLSKTFVHSPHDEAPDQKRDEETGWTAFGEGGGHLHVERCIVRINCLPNFVLLKI